MTSARRDKIHASLVGGAVGDALGNPVEFLGSMNKIYAAYGPHGLRDMDTCEITDDTQMTLFTIEGLLRAGEHDGEIIESVQAAYMRWLDTQGYTRIPPATRRHRTGWLREEKWLYARRAPGNTCISGLQADARDVYEALNYGDMIIGDHGPINPNSKGCGTVMRSAPFGMTGGTARQAFENAAECSYLTHGHPTSALSAGAFAYIVHELLGGRTLGDAVKNALRQVASYPGSGETVQALMGASRMAHHGPSAARLMKLGQGWIAEEALALAVYCVLAEPNPREALLLAVNHPGDSDSTGAIAGNLLGAMYGMSGIPADWAAKVEGRDTIDRLAADLSGA